MIGETCILLMYTLLGRLAVVAAVGHGTPLDIDWDQSIEPIAAESSLYAASPWRPKL